MDVINASNENSSLINSLNTAESTNLPLNYEITNNIKPTSVQWIKHTSNSSVGYSKTLEFDVSRFGYWRNCIIAFDMTGTADTINSSNGSMFDVIDFVEVLSSGRAIQKMTGTQLKVSVVNEPADARHNVLVGSGWGDTATGLGSGTAKSFYVNVPFSIFDNIRNCINTRFNEPLRLRIGLKDGKIWNKTGEALASATLNDVCVYNHYIRPTAGDDEKVVEANFGDGETLTKALYDYSSESETTYTTSTTAGAELKIDLKENGAVRDMYIICQKPITADKQTYKKPNPVKTIKLLGGGQTILELPAKLVKLYSNRTFGRGFCVDGGNSANATDLQAGMEDVYKISFGLDDSSHYFSGLVSFREINSPQLVLTLDADTDNSVANATCNVVYRKATLVSTDPSSGKNSVALSN